VDVLAGIGMIALWKKPSEQRAGRKWMGLRLMARSPRACRAIVADNVRFLGESGHRSRIAKCPLMTQSGHFVLLRSGIDLAKAHNAVAANNKTNTDQCYRDRVGWRLLFCIIPPRKGLNPWPIWSIVVNLLVLVVDDEPDVEMLASPK
jgi:hypothetical protein